MIRFVALLFCLGLFAKPCQAGATNRACEVRLLNLAGESVNPFQETNVSAIVFIFVSIDCPISNSYAPEFRRLNSEFSPKGVKFWLVYPGSDELPQVIQKHLREYEL